MFAFMLDRIQGIISRLFVRNHTVAPTAIAVTSAETTKPSLPPATAVAGFLQRTQPPTNFHLAARLASVSHLNTKAGRIPCSRQRPDARSKQMPKLQPRVVKRSTAPATKPLIAMAAQPLAQQNVVALINPAARCVPLDIRIARAA